MSWNAQEEKGQHTESFVTLLYNFTVYLHVVESSFLKIKNITFVSGSAAVCVW